MGKLTENRGKGVADLVLMVLVDRAGGGGFLRIFWDFRIAGETVSGHSRGYG